MSTLKDRLIEIEIEMSKYSDDLDILEELLEELKVLSSPDDAEDAKILLLLKECEDYITDLVLSTNIADL